GGGSDWIVVWASMERSTWSGYREGFRAPSEPEFIFFACPKKTNQKKGTPACAPFGFAPGLRGFADGPSMARRRTGRHPVGHPAGLILHPSAAPEGDPAARCAARFANQESYFAPHKNSRACGHVV